MNEVAAKNTFILNRSNAFRSDDIRSIKFLPKLRIFFIQKSVLIFGHCFETAPRITNIKYNYTHTVDQTLCSHLAHISPAMAVAEESEEGS